MKVSFLVFVCSSILSFSLQARETVMKVPREDKHVLFVFSKLKIPLSEETPDLIPTVVQLKLNTDRSGRISGRLYGTQSRILIRYETHGSYRVFRINHPKDFPAALTLTQYYGNDKSVFKIIAEEIRDLNKHRFRYELRGLELKPSSRNYIYCCSYPNLIVEEKIYKEDLDLLRSQRINPDIFHWLFSSSSDEDSDSEFF